MAFNKKKFKDAMRIEGVTQKDLAEKFGVDIRTVNRWLDPKYPIPSDKVRDLCFAINQLPNEFDPNWEGSAESPNVARVSAKVSSASKNGYWLMKKKYGVSETEICELAPILFALFAAAVYEKDERYDERTHKLKNAVRLLADDYGVSADGYDIPWQPYSNEEAEEFEEKLLANLAEGKIFGDDHLSDRLDEVAWYSGDRNPFNNQLEKFAEHSTLVKLGMNKTPGDCPKATGTAFDTSLTNYLTNSDPELNEAIADGVIELFSEAYDMLETKQERIEWMQEKLKVHKKRQAEHKAFMLKKYPSMTRYFDEKEDIEKIKSRWEIT